MTDLRCLFAAAVLLMAAPARADDACEAPKSLVYVDATLGHVKAQLFDQKEITIVVMGTASSLGAGLARADQAYPARLQQDLRDRLGKAGVAVAIIPQKGATAAAMVERMAAMMASARPSLVIWQTGTVDAIRGVDPDEFGATLAKGIDDLHNHGADVILMNMQFSPQSSAMVNFEPYLMNMAWVAQTRDVLLFDRYGVMKFWDQSGTFDFNAPTRSEAERTADKVHECIARLLSDMILEAATSDVSVKR